MRGGERGGATLNLDVASARRLCVCLEIRCDRAYVARCRVRWGSCWEAGWYRENSGGVESRRGGAERQSTKGVRRVECVVWCV